jgi:hypothetical protein
MDQNVATSQQCNQINDILKVTNPGIYNLF